MLRLACKVLSSVPAYLLHPVILVTPDLVSVAHVFHLSTFRSRSSAMPLSRLSSSPLTPMMRFTNSFLSQLSVSLIKSGLLSSSLSLTVTDDGLHPFIALTYFSAHPLNDKHSYTLTIHPSLFRSSSKCPVFLSLYIFTRPQLFTLFHFLSLYTPPSAILCTLLPFSSLLDSPPHCISCCSLFLLCFHPLLSVLLLSSLSLCFPYRRAEWQNDRRVIVSKG